MATIKRRTLGAALDVSPDKLAFIKGGVPTEQKIEPMASEFAPQPLVTQTTIPLVAAPIAAQNDGDRVIELENPIQDPESTGSTVRKARNRTRREQPNNDERMAGVSNLLSPITTRLTPTVAVALKRAGLEQRLYGRQPGTVQEIAEEAIKEWLSGQGYL